MKKSNKKKKTNNDSYIVISIIEGCFILVFLLSCFMLNIDLPDGLDVLFVESLLFFTPLNIVVIVGLIILNIIKIRKMVISRKIRWFLVLFTLIEIVLIAIMIIIDVAIVSMFFGECGLMGCSFG